MIKLQRSVVRHIQAATRPEELHHYLQKAVELEHSTIPPYLTAMFSLMPGTNDAIARAIREIVIEEMLHMTIAGNILIAIGGRPQINIPGFVPKYPGPLPMSIGGSEFRVGIEAFSMELLENTFMKIEEPEHPIPIKTLALDTVVEPEFATIGEFYKAIQTKLAELGDSIFVVPPEQQVLQWFSSDRLFPITHVDSAIRAIDIIVVEGEGTSTRPFQTDGELAHYYSFEEILHRRRIVPAPGGGFAFGGEVIPFDPNGVYPMVPNPQDHDFKENTQARVRVEQFAYSYSSLLNVLHEAFNGQPKRINTALGLMYDLKVQAVSLMRTPVGPDSKLTAGPSFEYVNTQGGMRFAS
ncbi:MAG TPA: ferritin-like protein [Myxococcaceae bacterium]|nr:ferritin-like protein [Myxococcaceae bacterium]